MVDHLIAACTVTTKAHNQYLFGRTRDAEKQSVQLGQSPKITTLTTIDAVGVGVIPKGEYSAPEAGHASAYVGQRVDGAFFPACRVDVLSLQHPVLLNIHTRKICGREPRQVVQANAVVLLLAATSRRNNTSYARLSGVSFVRTGFITCIVALGSHPHPCCVRAGMAACPLPFPRSF